ncbi:hypothetical protein HFX_6287 (plasmid) [Haloferax mediterranei ATCC 33500]|uniref:Uncharacterized protein n=1 Tax=Haloferax mediterranei (strain ATCC 33500 / DSM 1411 / JCM 8866 / NBRC 14739 / NCIMB 2177 / R-4) TaxID=523841 RepID=I3RAZ8_HALMT|nr:hypothetical protein HFX_6287 [Haloferax mediterranei ATCC 33500]
MYEQRCEDSDDERTHERRNRERQRRIEEERGCDTRKGGVGERVADHREVPVDEKRPHERPDDADTEHRQVGSLHVRVREELQAGDPGEPREDAANDDLQEPIEKTQERIADEKRRKGVAHWKGREGGDRCEHSKASHGWTSESAAGSSVLEGPPVPCV